MIKSLKIKGNLFVNALSITFSKKQEKEVETLARKEIILLDRSGSMHGYLNDIMNSTISYCERLPEGSEVMLGYFSGNNEYGLSVPYILKKELGQVTTTLNGFKNSLGMTNFVQILSKVNEIIRKSNDKWNLFFFSDGCHNTGGTWKDIETCLKEWATYAQVTCFVGYGYIDREKMSFMASITDGSFIHLDSFGGFAQSLTDFGESVEDSVPSVEVPIDFTDEDIIPISLSGEVIVEYSVVDKKVKFKSSKKGYKGLFFLTKNKVKGAEEVTELDITFEKGIRALATIHSQKNDANTSLELLNFIGDKYLVSALYNAIVPEEFSLAESKIRRTVFRTKERYLEGIVKNFLPDPNAFCVLDAVNVLSQDENAKIYIHDKDFEYQRIGRAQIQTDGPKVNYIDNGCSVSNIVMHKERLNIGILTNTKATVPLVPGFFKNNPFTINELDELGITNRDFPVQIFRNYNLIADGKLNTKKLVISDLSKDTIKQLGSALTLRKDKKYILDLTSLSLINKTYVKETSAKVLATNIWKEKLLMDTISFYTYMKKMEESKIDYVKPAEGLSEAATKFLEEHCFIKKGSYDPPKEAELSSDEYTAYEFSVDMKGFSKVGVKDVVKKILEKKKITPRELLIEEAYKSYKEPKFSDSKGYIEAMNLKIKELNNQLYPIRKQIQGQKFGIILGNKGQMDEFLSRENMELTLDCKSLLGVVLSVKFEFVIKPITIKI